MDKIKILHIIDSLEIGGAERIVSILATNLNNEIFDSAVLTLKQSRRNVLINQLEKKGIKIYSCDFQGSFDLKNHTLLKRLIRKIKPDIIHGHLRGLIAYYLWARMSGVRKFIYTMHSDPYNQDPSKIRQLLQSIAFHLGVVAVCISTASAKNFEKLYRLKAMVIKNCIDTENYLFDTGNRKKWRKKLKISESDFVFINVANFSAVKDHSLLLKSFLNAFKKESGVKLILVGSGPEKENIIKMVNRLSLNQKVIFTGMREDVNTLLSCADCFVLGSKTEGMPISLLEAVSCGLPVIVSNVGGITEVVQDHKNGLTFPPGNMEKFVSALHKIRENKTLRSKMSRANILLSSDYNASKMIDEYEKLYLNLSKTDK